MNSTTTIMFDALDSNMNLSRPESLTTAQALSQSSPVTMETTYQRNDSFRYLGNSVSLFNSVSLANTASLSNTSVNISANASDTGSYWDRNENLVKIEIAIQGTILYLALFGNIFVLVVLRLRRQKLSRMQWFIIHLTLADIFVAIFNTTPQLIMDITNKFYGDDFLCRFIKYVRIDVRFWPSSGEADFRIFFRTLLLYLQ